MKPWVILFCEGSHDVAVLGRIGRIHKGYTMIETLTDLRSFDSDIGASFEKSLLSTYPVGKNGDFGPRRILAPIFLKAPDENLPSVAIKPLDGKSNLDKGWATLKGFQASGVHAPRAVGFVFDADDAEPHDAAAAFSRKAANQQPMSRIPFSSHCPDTPNGIRKFTVDSAGYKVGLFVLPNATEKGDLETLLLRCAPQHYQPALGRAATFLKEVSEDLGKSPLIVSSPKYNKAQMSAVGAYLQPGLPSSVTYAEDDWISSANQAPPSSALAPLLDWLTDLLT